MMNDTFLCFDNNWEAYGRTEFSNGNVGFNHQSVLFKILIYTRLQ